VVTRFEGERAGIAVDEVMGQQQTVIKSLGSYIGSIAGISGATINGDGTMSLILDVPTLVAAVRRAAARAGTAGDATASARTALTGTDRMGYCG
jgi:two-component system chemotaxis sensor kinase CheA